MRTYIILTRFSPEAFRDPAGFKKLAEATSARIKAECDGKRALQPWGVLTSSTLSRRRM
jgi:hypothetical protein